jgi:hypothetical protein
MGKRTRFQKVNNSQGAFAVSCGIVNQQSAGQQEISGKKNPGSAVVNATWVAVSGRRNYVDSSATQIQMGNPVGPISETEKRSNSPKSMGTIWTDGRDAN